MIKFNIQYNRQFRGFSARQMSLVINADYSSVIFATAHLAEFNRIMVERICALRCVDANLIEVTTTSHLHGHLVHFKFTDPYAGNEESYRYFVKVVSIELV